MTVDTHTATSTVVPCLSYADAPAAIEWLNRAFGFEKHQVHEGPGGTIAHAELISASGMIMLGSDTNDDQWGMKSPRAAGGITQAIYVVVDDADEHHARATAVGAEIVRELHDSGHGSRDYSARDPEGHLWHFGTYRP